MSSESVARVELEQGLHQVVGLGAGGGEELGERLPGHAVGLVQDGLRVVGADVVDLPALGQGDGLHDLLYLVDGGGAWEEGLAQQHLGQDAAQAPHVHPCSVFLAG